MELIGIAILSFWVGLSGALMPGPLLTVTVEESIHMGSVAGVLTSAGHATLELILVSLLAFGVLTMTQGSSLFSVIAILGGLYLIWMARGMAVSARNKTIVELSGKSGQRTASGAYFSGITASISNPYWVLWWATIGIELMRRTGGYGSSGIAAFYLGHVGADFAWLLLVSVMVSKSRQWMKPRIYRTVIAICAIFLTVLGAKFLSDGIVSII